MESLEDQKTESLCKFCGEPVYFNMDYDALFCAKENIWLEKGCGDSSCEFCGKRPARPLDREMKL